MLCQCQQDSEKAGRDVPVVCGSVDDLEVLQCAHPDCRCCVEVEHEERGGDRDEGIWSICRQTIRDGTHGMLSHTIVDVSSTVVAGDATRRL
jgi:hypothetical protein